MSSSISSSSSSSPMDIAGNSCVSTHRNTLDYIDEKKAVFDLSKLEDLIQRKDYPSIIKDSELFFQAFCKSYAENSKVLYVRQWGAETRVCLYEKPALSILGNNTPLKKIKKITEIIRKIILERYESDQKVIFAMTNLSNSDHKIYLTSGAANDHYLTIIDKRCKVNRYIYRDYVVPRLPNLARLLGASYSDSSPGFTYLHEKSRIEFKFLPNEHSRYLIAPIEIPSSVDKFYQSYQKGDLCNLKLVAKGGEINVHDILFYADGGEVFQKMLSDGMKESEDKTINFPESNINTIKAFADFIYLGHEKFSTRFIENKTCDLEELLDFAHKYQIENLIDTCTNLLIRYSKTEDLENIKLMAEKHNNDHLKKLVTYLEIRASYSEGRFMNMSLIEHSLYHYLIDPIEIPSSVDKFYQSYQNGDLCNLKLVAKGGEINVHDLLFYTDGGEPLQKMLSDGMKESEDKTINFLEYNINTIKAFADFIYLGHEKFSARFIKNKTCDLGALLDFAHTYQIENLIDTCTNLLIRYAKIEDLENIKLMAEKYDNAHLKKLVAYFENDIRF